MYDQKYYYHKHITNCYCKTIADTKRGYKVQQIGASVTNQKKPQQASYDNADFNGPHAFWVPCNTIQVPLSLKLI